MLNASTTRCVPWSVLTDFAAGWIAGQPSQARNTFWVEVVWIVAERLPNQPSSLGIVFCRSVGTVYFFVDYFRRFGLQLGRGWIQVVCLPSPSAAVPIFGSGTPAEVQPFARALEIDPPGTGIRVDIAQQIAGFQQAPGTGPFGAHVDGSSIR
jgi:hypothetical protein